MVVHHIGMPRIEGISDQRANLLTRSLYSAARRKIGRVPEPMRITVHQGRLLAAMAGMEMAQQGVDSLDPALKALAEIRTATMIGCPF